MFAVDRSTTATVADAANDDFAIRQRLDSFKLGKVMPQSLSSVAPGGPGGHKHRRSHSRTTSVSSSSSIAASLSSSRSSGLNDLSSFSFGSLSTSASASTMSSSGSISSSSSSVPPAAPPTKRNSHHRRRSSVSTRRESAELMGVSLPDMPIASLEDNVNLGEKDSIRRRALLALEGKHTVAFNKVEIPELSTPDMEKMMFDFSTKPTLTGGLSTSFGNPMISGKRDSFKLLASSGSSKDQLHTLLEEEEEEDEEDEDPAPQCEKNPRDMLPSPTTSSEDHFSFPPVAAPVVAVTKPTPVRPRPATLNLRPLSLTPDNLGSTGLPTPSLTPSPRSGLRTLSLNPSTSTLDDSKTDSGKFSGASRRPVLNLSIDSTSDAASLPDDQKPVRRSSISYKSSSQSFSSLAGLPTPEMTPVLSRRCSITESIRSSRSGDEEFFPAHPSYRPLSVSEQHFLYKSHNALLARITDLEKALSTRRMSMGGYSISGGSRPSSVLSDASFPGEVTSPADGEPSDELLALVRDLKAERDELKKDVDGWRTRVADLDKQLVLVAKRVENERKEAWVARSRVGLLEAEKAVLEKRMDALDAVVAELEGGKADLEQRNSALQQEVDQKGKRIQELEAELSKVKQELESERSRTQDSQDTSAETCESDFITTPTPQAFFGRDKWSSGLGFALDTSEDTFNFGFPAPKMDDGAETYSDEEDELADYEDEEDGDSDMDTSSSFDSLTDYPQRSTSHLSSVASPELEQSNAPSSSATARPSHHPQRSLSKVWTFPKASSVSPTSQDHGHKHTESVDKFFGCLDESDTSEESGPVTPMPFNYEESKDLFASGFKYGDCNDAPFYLPDGVGTVVEEPEVEVKNDRTLAVVTEEDEEDEEDVLSDMEDDGDMFGEAGGIRIIFTPPDDVEEEKEVPQIQLASPVKPVSTPPTLPALDFGHDEDDDEDNGSILPFTFGRILAKEDNKPTPPVAETPSAPVIHPPSNSSPPSSLPRPTTRTSSPPSAIPRPASRTSTSPRSLQSNFVTPPSKRGGGSPSFIPQPVSSPSPSRVAPSPRPKNVVPGPTFIRQPSRTSPMAPFSPSSSTSKPPGVLPRNGSVFRPLNTIIHPLTINFKQAPRPKASAGIIRPTQKLT